MHLRESQTEYLHVLGDVFQNVQPFLGLETEYQQTREMGLLVRHR